MTITIRPAAPADLPCVGELHVRSRSAAYAGIVPADALDAVSGAAMGEWWAQRWGYERDTHRLAVAVDTELVLGFSYVGPAARAQAPTGELYAIHVDPEHQGAGIGQALMAGALETLAATGAIRAVLWVLTGNAAARRFYERAGWISDDVERMAPIGPAVTRQVRYSRELDEG